MYRNLYEANKTGPILITGHTGFKGSWLSLMLQHQKINHIGISLKPEKDSHANLINLDAFTNHRYIDIRNPEALDSIMEEVNPSVVIHMAAQPIVSKAFENIHETFEINVLGTMNVIEAARKIESVKSIAIVTTDKVYSNESIEVLSHKEESALGSNEPYGLSKVASELVVDAYNAVNEVIDKHIYTFRSGNVIGGGDLTANRLLPELSRHVFNNEKLKIRNPNASRPWQHVLDTLHGYLLGIEFNLSGKFERSFNFSPIEPSLTVNQVLEVAAKKYKIDYTFSAVAAPSAFLENTHLDLDSRKARELLGWGNVFTQETAILDTLNWWGAINSGENPLSLAEESIENFYTKLTAK